MDEDVITGRVEAAWAHYHETKAPGSIMWAWLVQVWAHAQNSDPHSQGVYLAALRKTLDLPTRKE